MKVVLPAPTKRPKYKSYCHGCGTAGMKGAMHAPDGEPCPKCGIVFCLDCLPRHYFWSHVKRARKLYSKVLKTGRIVL